METRQSCALPDCTKYIASNSSYRNPENVTCSELHYLLVMAGRFNPDLKIFQLQIRERNSSGHCGLTSCTHPPSADDIFCSRDHRLEWMCCFASTFQPEQRCKLEGCVRHVFVREDSKREEFCGWRHTQKHVMLSAMKCRVQIPCKKEDFVISSPSASEFSVEFLVDALRKYADGGSVPNGIQVEPNFFSKHPWDICEGKRNNRTKEGYHWKQQGQPKNRGSHVKKRYFTYEKLKGSQVNINESCYHMDQYTVDDIDKYSIITLKGKPNTKIGNLSPNTINDEWLSSDTVDDNDAPNGIIHQDADASEHNFYSNIFDVEYSNDDEVMLLEGLLDSPW
ncbi:hypothetical protein KP509_37G035000 [Ceratopteris richardii]|uniref:Uncharacterized protein n=1 Tax=Ceratopteris richardii TaxID=49495 RepID=A0A8T2Q7Z7_CERRI|nr:hypothetical protein KP509_37G035000 [Ceratopteris richardii]